MNVSLKLPVKKGDKIYTIHRCEIEMFYVEDIITSDIKDFNSIDCFVTLVLQRYNDGVNFYSTKALLSNCFFSKEDLVKNLLKD